MYSTDLGGVVFVCPSCGFHNPPAMRFCGNCGNRLVDSAGQAAPVAETASPTADRLGILVGADLKERFRQAGLEATGQRRNVTVLFADLCDYTGLAAQVDDEDLYDLIQGYIQLLAEKVYQYEGIVDKIIGDGLMALFGAPIAHENNAERAVRAALDMQADLERLNQEWAGRLGIKLQMHLGLNAGTVIVGGVGSDLLMDYTAIGDTVNLARRLEEAAPPGGILVSESVYKATQRIFDFAPVQDLRLKGITRPFAAYRLGGVKTQPGNVRGLEGLRAPMVGREPELQKLQEAVQALHLRKRGTFILLSGEAGIGKSRLTQEFKSHIDQTRQLVVEGQSLTYRRSVSYWIFLELLRDYLQISPQMSSQAARRRLISKVNELLGSQAAELLPYLEHIFSFEHSDPLTAQRLAYLDAGQLRQQIFLAVRDLLAAEAFRQPLVLILEDLHWADDASLDLLAFLFDSLRQAPLLIFANSRPVQDGKLKDVLTLAQKRLGEEFVCIPLPGLTPEQGERLLSELLASPKLPDAFRQQILQRAAGIPFYLEEILRVLIDEGVIHQADGHWRLAARTKTVALRVPDNLQDLILARFDRLEQFQRKVLQSASVIGRQFSLPVLAGVMKPVNEPELDGALKSLVERAFLLAQAQGTETRYLFRHVLTSDAVYSTLLRRDRNELHGRVGETIEGLYADRLEEQIEVLAGHYLRSSRLDRALHYLILAGQKAARDYASEQARAHFTEANNLLPKVSHTPDGALQVRVGLGDVLVFVGEYSEARQYYQSALETVNLVDPGIKVRQTCALQRKIGTTYERQGDYDQALTCLGDASRVLEDHPTTLPVEKANVFNDLGWIHFLRGNFEQAKASLSEGLSLVEATQQYDVIASIHNRLGAVAYQQRAYDEADTHVRQSLALREAIGDLAGVARLYNNLGLLGLMRGDLRYAETNFLQSVELLERLGDAEGIALANINAGLVKFDRGNFEAAKKHLETGFTLAEQIGHRFYLGLARMYLGRLSASQGQFLEAENQLQECMHVFEELGAQDNLIDAATYLAENYLAQGDFERSMNWAVKSLDLIRENGNQGGGSVQYGRILRLQGAISRRRGELEGARQMLEESAALFHAAYEKLEAARSEFELGLLAYMQDDSLKARGHFQAARMTFGKLGADTELQRVEQALNQVK
jgi:class 3 adenylate cyclase/tetratricopeptide (TPR) repeat protein